MDPGLLRGDGGHSPRYKYGTVAYFAIVFMNPANMQFSLT
jgi:hypothetical protein